MIVAAISRAKTNTRRTMPSPIVTSAASEPMPILNGLTVEPMMPADGANQTTPMATIRSYPRARNRGIKSGYMPSVSSLHDITEPSRPNSRLRAMINKAPRSAKRCANLAMPRLSAPVSNTTVMNPPMARMKMKTWTPPNMRPLLNGPTCPVSRSWMPYMPFTGDSRRSSTRSDPSSGASISW